jgi:hypothetical protein
MHACMLVYMYVYACIHECLSTYAMSMLIRNAICFQVYEHVLAFIYTERFLSHTAANTASSSSSFCGRWKPVKFAESFGK